MASIQSIRQERRQTLTLASGATATAAVDFRRYAMLAVHMGSTWTSASIGFQVSDEEGGTYRPLYDQYGSLVQIVTATNSVAYTAPPEIAPVRYFKLWSQNGSGTSITQAATSLMAWELLCIGLTLNQG